MYIRRTLLDNSRTYTQYHLGEKSAPPAYLANGIQQWQNACAEQAKYGFAAVAELNQKGYVHFATSACAIMHHHPKDMSIFDDVFPTINKRMKQYVDIMTKRSEPTYVMSGNIVVPEFRALMTESTLDDIVSAGSSYIIENIFDEMVKEMVQSDLDPKRTNALTYRCIDVEANDRSYNEQERTLMYDAIVARHELKNWMQKTRKENEFYRLAREDWPIDAQEEARRLESAEKALTDAWWQQVKQYVAKEQK